MNSGCRSNGYFLKYRADIDGLRAIAILCVVLYHMDMDLFSGGYVGVDVFFVISGYLINSIIYNKLEDNSFSLYDFYIRRVRRLFPALFVVICVTFFASIVILAPPHLKSFGQSIITTILFSSNILFWKQSNYFNTAAECKPLLHTWSLGIEEQFYIFFPLFLMLIFRFGKKKIYHVLIGIFIASFCLCVWKTKLSPPTAFYLLPFRAWEILLGVLISIGIYPKFKKVSIKNIISIVGLLLILGSTNLLSKATPFPSFYALLPAIGTYLIIVAGIQQSSLPWINRILQSPPLVLIGLLSYSLYLWHWPVLSYRKYLSFLYFSDKKFLFLCLVLTLALSLLSYQFIEKPFRSRHFFKKTGRLVNIIIFASASLISLGVFLNTTDGKVLQKMGLTITENCVNIPKPDKYLPGYNIKAENVCMANKYVLGDTKRPPSTILFGDSHSQTIAWGISEVAKKDYAKSFLFFGDGGLLPLLGIRQFRPDKAHHIKLNQKIYDLIAKEKSLKNVVLIARWMAYFDPKSTKDNWNYYLYRETDEELNFDNNKVFLKEQLEYTIQKLKSLGKNVYIILDLPTHVPSLSQRVALGNRISFLENSNGQDYIQKRYSLSEFEHKKLRTPFNKILTQLQRKYDFSIIDYAQGLLEDSKYIYIKNNTLLYLDDDHLNSYGSHYLAKKNKAILNEIL